MQIQLGRGLRLGWVSVLGWSLSGCLWLGPQDHAERKAQVAIDLGEVKLTPDAWSTCSAPSAVMVVTAEVSAASPQLPFSVWVEVDGERHPLGEQTAALDGATAQLSVTLPVGELVPPCPEGCTVPLRIGASRVGLEQSRELMLEILPEGTPELAGVALVDPNGARTALQDVLPLSNPTHGLDTERWPTLVLELADRHLLSGLGGSVELWACPSEVAPEDASDAGPCVRQPALAALQDTRTGDLAFRLDTELLGAGTCDAVRSGSWPGEDGGALYAVVTGHVCGEVAPLPLSAEPRRFVVEDCDADGASPPEDCADTDASRHPSAEDIPHDGIDSDCSGDNDFDIDGDGSLFPTDCDDSDASSFPGAVEVCDGRDNDCLGDGEPEGATLFGQMVQNFADLQEALDQAQPNDTVVICPGTYTGPFSLAAGTIRGVTEQGGVTLQGGSADAPVLTLGDPDQPAGSATLQSLTVQGGVSTSAGGIDGRGVLALTVEDSVVQDNLGGLGGGLALSGLVTLRRTELVGNRAARGGGMWLDTGTELRLEAVTVRANDALEEGGGIYAQGSAIEGDFATLLEVNTAALQGGGLWATGSLELDLQGGVLRANAAPQGAALALVSAGGEPLWELDDLLVEDHDDPSILQGAGLWAQGADAALVVTDSTFTRNRAAERGGALYAEGAGIGMVDTILLSNEASQGGGIALSDAVLLSSLDEWADNAATDGGALWAEGSFVAVGLYGYGSLVSGNQATGQGGGLWLGPSALYDSELVTDQSTLSGNAAASGGGLYLEGGEHLLYGGSIDNNLASAAGGGGGLMVTGGARLTLAGGLSLAGNAPTGGELVDESIEACAGVSILDPIENTTDHSPPGAACFLLLAAGDPLACEC